MARAEFGTFQHFRKKRAHQKHKTRTEKLEAIIEFLTKKWGGGLQTFISVEEIIQIVNVSIGVISKFVFYTLNEILNFK